MPRGKRLIPAICCFGAGRPSGFEGEIIRDAILATTGTLDPTMFGAGTLDAAMKRRKHLFPDQAQSASAAARDLRRAGHAAKHRPARATTTVAPQSLLLMNNTAVRAAARSWAKSLAGLPLEEAIRRAYLAALGRAPSDGERADVGSFIAAQTASYQVAGRADAEELALTDFCQSMPGLNEFVYVE